MPRKRVRRNEREHGRGSIKDLADGSARAWRPPQPDGKRPSRVFHPPNARQKAEAWLRGLEAGPTMTLGLWNELWVTRRAARLRPSTLPLYRRWFGWLTPLAPRQLASITADEWQQTIDNLLTRYSWVQVHRARAMWSAALSAAVRAGHLTSNPLLDTALPRPEEKIPPAWSREDALRLLAAARGERHEAWLHLALSAGLRMGELRALTWPGLDLRDVDRATVTVARSLDNRTDKEGPTKSGKVRVVDLPPETAELLAAHRKRQDPACSLVLGRVDGPVDPTTYRWWLKRLCASAGVAYHPPHALRHTFASLAIERGVPLTDLSDALGHASIIVTGEVYSHFISRQARRTARALGDALYGAPEPEISTLHRQMHNPDASTR